MSDVTRAEFLKLQGDLEDLKHAVVTLLREKEKEARREYRRLRKRIDDDNEGRQMALFGGLADDLEGSVSAQ